MADGPPKKQDQQQQRKPAWTERSVPETYRPGPTRPLSADDDGLVPAADPIVAAAYKRTGALPVRPVMNRGDDHNDALVIQRVAKEVRVLAFEIDGVHWRAGFAPEVGQTPLSQYVNASQPPESEIQAGNGFILRPVEPELELVLRELIPVKLRTVEEGMFGRGRELGGLYLYFAPQPGGAIVGMAAWYLPTATSRQHLLYLQTEVKKADARLIDEMHKTFRASNAARERHGDDAVALDFWAELQLATTQVEATIRNSSFGRNSAEVRGLVRAAREQAENGLDQGMRRAFRLTAAAMQFAVLTLPQMLLAQGIRVGSKLLIGVIRAVDRMISRP